MKVSKRLQKNRRGGQSANSKQSPLKNCNNQEWVAKVQKKPPIKSATIRSGWPKCKFQRKSPLRSATIRRGWPKSKFQTKSPKN